MKLLPFIVFLLFGAVVRAEDLKLPIKLPAYEEYVVRTLGHGIEPSQNEGLIRVRVASGIGEDVQKHAVLELPRGSTVMDAAAAWQKSYGGMVMSGTRGLVAIRRKVGSHVEHVTWSQRQARTEAPKFQLLDGDVLIGILYGDR